MMSQFGKLPFTLVRALHPPISDAPNTGWSDRQLHWVSLVIDDVHVD